MVRPDDTLTLLLHNVLMACVLKHTHEMKLCQICVCVEYIYIMQ